MPRDLLLLLFRNDQAVKQCKDDPTIIAACMLQSFYEAAMVPAQKPFRSLSLLVFAHDLNARKPRCLRVPVSVHFRVYVDTRDGGPYYCPARQDSFRPDLRVFYGDLQTIPTA